MKRIILVIAITIFGGINMVNAKGLNVGDKAPDFKLPSQNDTEVSLSDFLGKKDVVLYFYPKDNTGVCDKQACAFRDAFDVFTDEGAQVIGVSGDSVESHKKFAKEKRLPFILLSDPGHKLAKEYGIGKWMGLLYNRVTFVIDKDGIIRHKFKAMLKADKHIEESLEVLKSL